MARSKYYNPTTQQWEYADRNPLPTGQDGDILVNENGVWVAKPKWQMIYQPVEYIESNPSSREAGQRIVTDYIPNNRTIIESEIAFTGSSAIDSRYMGARYWKTATDMRSFFFGRQYSSGVPYLALFTMYPEASPARIEYDSDFHTFLITPTLQKIDDNEFYLDYSDTPDDNVLYFTMFAMNEWYYNANQSYEINKNFIHSKAKIKWLKIKEGETLLCNFIPCYNVFTGETGMYETVAGKFFANAGTGTFLKGGII